MRASPLPQLSLVSCSLSTITPQPWQESSAGNLKCGQIRQSSLGSILTNPGPVMHLESCPLYLMNLVSRFSSTVSLQLPTPRIEDVVAIQGSSLHRPLAIFVKEFFSSIFWQTCKTFPTNGPKGLDPKNPVVGSHHTISAIEGLFVKSPMRYEKQGVLFMRLCALKKPFNP